MAWEVSVCGPGITESFHVKQEIQKSVHLVQGLAAQLKTELLFDKHFWLWIFSFYSVLTRMLWTVVFTIMEVSANCHINYIVYLKLKILMDGGPKVPMEARWQNFFPITFSSSSLLIFSSIFFRISSCKGLLFTVRTFSFMEAEKYCTYSCARANSEAIQARLWPLCIAKSITQRWWDSEWYSLISSVHKMWFFRGRRNCWLLYTSVFTCPSRMFFLALSEILFED